MPRRPSALAPIAALRWPALALALATAAACGGDDDDGDDQDDHDGGGGGSDAGGDLDFVELIGADYVIEPGDEPYRCARLTMSEDVYITAFVDQSPLGTHHTVLSLGSPQGADGEFACDVGDNRTNMMFASGVGSDAFEFPEGVAVRVAAGQQVQLNVHLYNASTEPLSGRAAVKVHTVPAAELGDVELAEMILAGPLQLEIEASGEAEDVNASCRMAADGTILNLWPHMHKLGTHMQIRLNDEIKLDEPYSFEEQVNWPTRFGVAEGDMLNVTCTYVNDTGEIVRWGESSDEEMCFAGFYRYPATGAGVCASF